MNRRPRQQKLVAEINITPFTDVILVLLVIFMITTPLLSQPSLNVDLPKASTAQSGGEKAQISVTITKDGSTYLDGKRVNKKQLKEKASQIQKSGSKVSVLLNIDQAAQFKNVVEALDVLRGLGIHDFGIAAKQE